MNVVLLLLFLCMIKKERVSLAAVLRTSHFSFQSYLSARPCYNHDGCCYVKSKARFLFKLWNFLFNSAYHYEKNLNTEQNYVAKPTAKKLLFICLLLPYTTQQIN